MPDPTGWRAARSGSPVSRRSLVVGGVLAAVAVGLAAAFWHLLTPALSFDEQWRARRITLPHGFWTGLRDAEAPSSLLWLGLERLAAGVFGNRELALRLPVVPALLVLGLATYRLTRRVAPHPWPLVTGALVMTNASLLVYGLLLKPYVVEAAAAALAVELWLVARTPPVTVRRLVAAYGGLAALTLIATPLLFLLPGLIASDVLGAGAVERDERRTRRALAAGVGAVAAAHYVFFLAPQSRLVTATEGFSAMYAPFASGLGATARFLRAAGVWFLRLPTSAGFLPPDVYEGAGEVDLSTELWPLLTRLAMVGVAVALASGVVATWRRADLRPVPVTLAVALAVQLVVSGDGRWPFGANRTNLFLLPLLAFLVAAGVAWLAGHARRSRPHAALLCGVSLALVAALPLQVARLRQLRRDGAGYPLFVGLRAAVVHVRATAGPTDVVVVSSPPQLPPGAFAGWDYYMHRYEGLPAPARHRPAVPPDRTLLVTDPDEPLQAFLARPSERPGRIYLLELWNFTEEHRSVGAVQRLSDDGWCATRHTPVRATGLLVELRPDCPGAR